MTAASEESADVRFRVLGPVEYAGEIAGSALGGRRQRSLLAMLVARAGEVITAGSLVEAVWGEAAPGRPLSSVQTYMSSLRRVIAERIEYTGIGYRLEAPPQAVDAVVFERLLGSAQSELERDPEVATDLLDEALSLWRGDAFEDVADAPGLRLEVGRLDALRVVALEARMRAGLACGDTTGLAARMEPWLEPHILRESFVALFVSVLAAEERQAEALRVLDKTRTRLLEELGVSLGPSLQKLEGQLLHQDPEVLGVRSERRATHRRHNLATEGSSFHGRQDDVASVAEANTMSVRKLAAILILDVVNSTQSMADDEDGTLASLGRLRELSEMTIGAHHGRVVKGTGDGVLAEFPSVLGAVKAALEIQDAHQRQATGSPALALRIGVTLGDVVVEEDGDIYGEGVNVASRIERMAEPGSVCVSESVHTQVANKVDARFSGPSHLDVAGRTIRVWTARSTAVDVSNARQEPASDHIANAPARHRTAPPLPRYLTAFVGRESELERVTAALQRFRLVRLVGASGVGKTRMAVEAAGALSDTAVAFVEMIRGAGAESILPVISSSFGIVEDRSRTLRESLVRALEGPPLLLVLDNLERDGATKEVLEFLLRRVPNLSILTTGLGASGAAGERVIQVPPLSLEGTSSESEALSLLLARTRAIDVDITDPQEVDAAARLCEALDGIPLAIEFAAARARVLNVKSILLGLDEQLRSLRSGWGTSESRHETLVETVEWSFDLLTEPAKRTAGVISLFPGGIGFDDLVRIVDDMELVEVLDALEELVDASFVTYNQEGRYRMYDVTAALMRPRLESLSVSSRHAIEWASDLARTVSETFLTADFGQSMERAFKERDNLRSLMSLALETNPESGLEMAAGLSRYWLERLEFTEGRTRLELAVNANPGSDTDAMIEALAALGRMQFQTGHLTQGLETAERAVALVTEVSASQVAAQARITVATILSAMGLLPEAYGMIRGAANDLDESEPYRVVVLAGIVSVATELGEFEAATAALEEVRASGADDSGVAPWLKAMEARLALTQGNLDHAQELINDYKAWAEGRGVELFQAFAAVDLGSIALRRGDFQHARTYAAEATKHLDTEPSPEVMHDVFILTIWTETLSEDRNPLQVIREALAHGLATPDAQVQAHALMAAAVVHARSGSYHTAARLVAAAEVKREETQLYVSPQFSRAFDEARRACRRALGDTYDTVSRTDLRVTPSLLEMTLEV